MAIRSARGGSVIVCGDDFWFSGKRDVGCGSESCWLARGWKW